MGNVGDGAIREVRYAIDDDELVPDFRAYEGVHVRARYAHQDAVCGSESGSHRGGGNGGRRRVGVGVRDGDGVDGGVSAPVREGHEVVGRDGGPRFLDAHGAAGWGVVVWGGGDGKFLVWIR